MQHRKHMLPVCGTLGLLCNLLFPAGSSTEQLLRAMPSSSAAICHKQLPSTRLSLVYFLPPQLCLDETCHLFPVPLLPDYLADNVIRSYSPHYFLHSLGTIWSRPCSGIIALDHPEIIFSKYVTKQVRN